MMSNQPAERPHTSTPTCGPHTQRPFAHYSYAPCALSNIYDVHFGQWVLLCRHYHQLSIKPLYHAHPSDSLTFAICQLNRRENRGKSRKIEEKENRFQLTACCCLLLVYLLIKFKAHRWQKTTLHPTIYYSLLPSKQKRRGKLQTTEKTGAKFALYLLAISRPLFGATVDVLTLGK